jgi:tetratricopeptide (TPR) repeat protein
MRNVPITVSGLMYSSLLLTLPAQAESTPEQLLLQQIQVGEYSHRDDIIEQALYRLESIDPKNPQLIAAKIRRSLRQQDRQKAADELAQLYQLAPDSDVYQQSKAIVALYNDDGQQHLQQARLLATTGHLDEARAAFDALFKGNPPTVELAVEYWQLVARLPNQRPAALKQLQDIERKTPGNPQVRIALVNMLFSQGDDKKGFALLQLMAADPNTAGVASEIWLQKINDMPVSSDSIAQLQLYQTLYSEGAQYTQAQQVLEQQKKDLATPGFVARQQGLYLADKGDDRKAIPSLREAIKHSPNDAEVVGALGLAYAGQGNRAAALPLLEKAESLDNHQGKWQSAINTNRYWLLIQQADAALSANNLSLAKSKYQQARNVNSGDVEALLGLGNTAVAEKDDATAERYYQQALRIEPYNSRAVSRLVDIYQRQSPEKAMNYLNSLSQRQRASMNTDIKNFRSSILQNEAGLLEKQQDWQRATDKLTEAQRLTPDDVWLTYSLARDLQRLNQGSQADALFDSLSERRSNDPEAAYAHALYLSGSDRTEQALQRLNRLPSTKWNDDISQLSQRLQRQATLARAEGMRRRGDEAGAIRFLQQQPADNDIDLTLGDWAIARGDYSQAHAAYGRVLQREPNNQDARLGEIDAYLGENQQNEARRQLEFFDHTAVDSINSERRIADAWLQTGDQRRADKFYQSMRDTVSAQPPSPDNALVWRDLASYEGKMNRAEQALDDYRQAMLASGITTARPENNEEFTRLMRNQPDDDWLKRSIRSNADELYQRQNTTITLDHDYWGSSGTKGISDLTAQTTMLEIDTPLYDGRAFARADYVQMNAGTFSAESGGKYYEKFGTCYEVGCASDFRQKTDGTSLALGWRNDVWNVDIGTTPFGFEVVDWVGGVGYKTDWNNIGVTFSASRRPISSSLLSFAGSKDPNTGISWGGVRATGGAISLSYDRGEAHGVWADLSAHQITGKNVEDNQRARLMGGYYYRVINEDNREVTVGVSSMLWRYQKDLSHYSLGQGGYYSPQSYFSLGLPINYRQRTENWSWELAGSVSWSTSTTDDRRRYPIKGLAPADLPDIDAIETGGKGSGVGYTLRALVERRLTSHWSIGAGVDIQEAKDYTPSHALLYVRYSFDDWRGNMDMPPRPLTPYADFK